MQFQDKLIVAAGYQFIAAGLDQVDNDTGSRWCLPVHADTYGLHPVAIHANMTLLGRSYRIGQVQHDPRGRVQSVQLRGQLPTGSDLNADPIFAVSYLEPLQRGPFRSARARAPRLSRCCQ